MSMKCRSEKDTSFAPIAQLPPYITRYCRDGEGGREGRRERGREGGREGGKEREIKGV